MAYGEDKKQALRNAYIYKHLSIKDAANMVGIPYGTARAWKAKAQENEDDWDVARNAARMAAGGLGELTNALIENFAIQSESILNHIKSDVEMTPGQKVDVMTKLSDSYSKLVASATKSGTKVAPLAVAMQVLQLLGDFVKDEYPQHATAFVEILEPFGRLVAEKIK